MRQQGTVQRWLGSYGFIMSLNCGGKGGAIFVHHRDIIEMEGYRQLFPGDVVEFEIAQGERGSHAAKVKVIQSAETGEPREWREN
jgi:cold shock CspA family protein